MALDNISQLSWLLRPSQVQSEPREGPPLKFKDLSSLSGANRFLRALGGDEKLSPEIREIARRYLEENPRIADVEVGKVPEGADSYSWGFNTLGVSGPSPDVLSHEASHAKKLHEDSLYRDILAASKKAVSISNLAAIPAILGISALIKDNNKKNTILKTLAGMSAFIALPNLVEETRATADALSHSEDRIRALASLGPGLATHLAHDMMAPMAYYFAGSNLGLKND